MSLRWSFFILTPNSRLAPTDDVWANGGQRCFWPKVDQNSSKQTSYNGNGIDVYIGGFYNNSHITYYRPKVRVCICGWIMIFLQMRFPGEKNGSDPQQVSWRLHREPQSNTPSNRQNSYGSSMAAVS